MLKALIFDVDGTLADTEDAHRAAFNAAFKDAGLPWHWSPSEYTRLLDVSGGKERIWKYWREIDSGIASTINTQAKLDDIHNRKTRHYEALVERGHVPMRPGMVRLIKESFAAKVPMAIATTTTPANIDVLLRSSLGRDWRKHFKVVRDGHTDANKKPAPDVYFSALRELGFKGEQCLAVEDSHNGLIAARAASVPTLITPTSYTAAHCFDGALQVLDHMGDPDNPLAQNLPGMAKRWVDLEALRLWHKAARTEHAAS